MSVATVTSPIAQPPPPSSVHMSLATTDPVAATDALNPSEDPFAHYIRTSISSRAPPRALSPRVYGRSPRLPSALPLSASPRLAEPVTPDHQQVFPLFATDEVMDLPPRPDDVVVDPASESERQSRVEGRLRWARSLPPFRPAVKKNDDVVDDDDAAKLFMSVPRKFRSGSSAPPLPAMNVPDVLCPPDNNRQSVPSQPSAVSTRAKEEDNSADNSHAHRVVDHDVVADCDVAVNDPINIDDTLPSINNNTMNIISNLNNKIGCDNVSMSITSMDDSNRIRDFTNGMTCVMPPPTTNTNANASLLGPLSNKMQTEVPTLQLPELAPIRPHGLLDSSTWDAPFIRSPGLARSPNGFMGSLSRDALRDVMKDDASLEIKLELSETPALSLPTTSKVGAQLDHMTISKQPAKRPLASPAAAMDKIKVRRCQGRKPPTHPTHGTDNSESPRCEICGTKFARKSNLNKHLRSVHEDVRKFPCELCSLKFKRQDHLIKHKRSVHAKLRKFTCDLCGIGFAEKFNRDKHRRNIHNNKRAFQCGCGAYFQDREKMLNCLKCKQLTQMNANF